MPEGLLLEALKCSSDGEDIFGTVAVIGSADDEANWGEELKVYQGMDREFLLLHPKCLHDLLDEVLRQERATVHFMSLGPVNEVREALEM